jgi:hypothetical protein
MRCLGCGFCCIKYDVVIVKDPTIHSPEDDQDNFFIKKSGEKCPHLNGDHPGEFECMIHHYPWFFQTPCGQFNQIEREESECRIGDFLMKIDMKKREKFICKN